MHANPHVLLILATLFWAGQWIVARAIVPYTTPITMSFLRWSLAIVLLAPFAAPAMVREWPQIRRAWRPILFFGTCGTVVYNAIAYYGIQQSTAVNALLFQSVIPVLIPGFAWMLFRERIHMLTALGLAVSLVGVLAIVSRLDASVVATLALNPGDVFLLVNIVLWSIYTACLRWMPVGLDGGGLMLAIMLAGMLSGVPLWLIDLVRGGFFEPNTASVLGMLYICLFPALLCYFMWNRGVAAVGPARAGAYLHLSPPFGTLLAIVFLGEELHAYHVLGFALILLGVWLAARKR
jgi:drug/metabolite transporter (DMT)-like permease